VTSTQSKNTASPRLCPCWNDYFCLVFKDFFILERERQSAGMRGGEAERDGRSAGLWGWAHGSEKGQEAGLWGWHGPAHRSSAVPQAGARGAPSITAVSVHTLKSQLHGSLTTASRFPQPFGNVRTTAGSRAAQNRSGQLAHPHPREGPRARREVLPCSHGNTGTFI